jgi:NitT/TauT family transport system substrate-binding protein
LLYIAADQGLFEQQGVAVELVDVATASIGGELLATKRVEGATTLLADMIAQASAGLDNRVVWAFDASEGGDFIVGKPEITNIADLRGKRIGVAYASFGYAFLVAGLQNAGLSVADIQIINIDADQVPEALATDQIDAGHTYAPFIQAAFDAGYRTIFTSADTPGIITDVLAFNQGVIEERPDDIQKVIHALVAADAWWQGNPDAGNAIIAARSALPVEELPAFFQEIHLHRLEENVDVFEPTSQVEDSIWLSAPKIISIFQAGGIVESDNIPAVENLLDGQFVQAAAAAQPQS